ncbi:CMP-sialic acid transporter [Pycnococcus provasolii]
MDAVDLAGPDRDPRSSGDFEYHQGNNVSGPGSGASERSSGADHDHARSDSLKGNPNHLNSLNNAGLAKPPAKISAQERAVRIALVGGDCFLIGLQPILTHMSKNKSGKFSYSPVSVNFLVEVVKVLFSVGLLCCIGGGKGDAALRKDKQALLSVRGFLAAAHKNRLLMVPALLYSANNYLKFAMQLYFAPATVKMLSNLKVVSIALLLKLIMKRTFSILQWEALFLLLLGITINQLSCTASSPAIAQLEAESAKNPVAWVYTLASCTIPAAASVFNEYALKKNFQTSVHLQNFFMYFYGLLFNLAGLLATNLTTTNPAPIFSGYSRVTLILVVNNAMQGILSSLFFKFADTILKKYSSTVATILTALMSAALFGHSLSMHFAIGVSMVFVSMHQFFTTGKTIATEDKAAASRGTFSHSPSMDHLQLHNSGATSARHRTSGAILPR